MNHKLISVPLDQCTVCRVTKPIVEPNALILATILVNGKLRFHGRLCGKCEQKLRRCFNG